MTAFKKEIQYANSYDAWYQIKITELFGA